MSTIAAFWEEARGGAWKVVLASLIGVSLGLTALPFYTLGVFAGPLGNSFGWSRGVAQSGLIFSMIGTVFAAAPAAWLIRRVGVRATALMSQAGLAAGFLIFAFQDGNPVLWRASWLLLAVLGIGTTPLTWSFAIGRRFERGRGLALGIALAGTGITAFLAPPLMTALIASAGWRVAYVAIALAVLLVAMPAAALLLREDGTQGAVSVDVGILTGIGLGEALRRYRFWLILVAFAGISFGIGGVIPNLVPMLRDAGVTNAAFYASLLGINVIFGRIVSGYMLDRFWAPGVACVLLSLPALACVMLANDQLPWLAAILVGLAGGAEFDLIAYLCARYFGMRHFGPIYAWQWASFSVAAGVGALSFGLLFDSTGSYRAPLHLASALTLAGGLSLIALGRYPRLDPAK